MMKRFSLLITLLIIISCNSETDHLHQVSDATELMQLIEDENSFLKKEFALAFSMVLSESALLRSTIKTEALKMFDKDYDVLYASLSTLPLENGNILSEELRKYFKNPNLLNQITIKIPNLTILVPKLPLNTFSAELWDTKTQIPEVAIRLNHSNKVPVFKSDGTARILTPSQIPAFPVLVIKENERVISTKQINTKLRKEITGSTFRTKSNEEFTFLSDTFNGLELIVDLPDPDGGGGGTGGGSGGQSGNNKDQRLIDAYNIYNNINGWHRDYIYYNISPTTTKGEFSYDFQEQITSFSLNGDAFNAYDEISQADDPKPRQIAQNGSQWTNGFFEFKVRVLINGKNGVGSELVTYFPADPQELFDIEYLLGGYILIESISLKTMELNLPLINWDLNQYSSSIKIEIEEVDLTVTTVITDSRSVKFANNFSIDPTDGILKKIGLKFGSTLETNTTQTIQKTFTQGNDELGAVIINFADKIITGQETNGDYKVREYSTGEFKLTMEPVRVQ